MVLYSIIGLLTAFAGINEENDTLRNMELDEVNIVSTLKESGTLRQQPASVMHVGGERLWNQGVTDLKGMGTMMPNFYMPDYGTKQTSAIYVRGIGSRIGTPAIGLYVDNVAYYEKSSFDFSFLDVESIDLLRGPQSTLYGRNTMGGVIKVKTRNPFDYQGTEIKLGFSSKNYGRKIYLTNYGRLSDKLSFSIGGFYDGNNGIFRNSVSGDKIDKLSSGGGKLRVIFKNNDKLTIDFSSGYEYSDEGAYPYYYKGTVDATSEQHEALIDKISSNLQSFYRRGLFNASVNLEYKTQDIVLNSVTSYQNITDNMFMDQDFISDDIYSLGQKQKINTLSEEMILKNHNDDGLYQWLTGMNVFYQSQNIIAPVAFRKDGLAWINAMANAQAQTHLPHISMGTMGLDFQFSDYIKGNQLVFDDDFDTPTMGMALFHQSTIKSLFGVEGLSGFLGVRLDYEKMWMKYNSWYDFTHTYGLKGLIMMGPVQKEIDMVEENTYDKSRTVAGKLSNDYLQVLPKISVKYDFTNGNVYAAVSRGYRSGGYNAQNISEVMRSYVQTDMMHDVCDATIPVMENQKMIPQDVKQNIKGVLESLAEEKEVNIQDMCGYDPEYAWNYEVGTHLSFINHKVNVDFSAFVSNVTNLQLSRMSETGLGRMITNAGRSRSMGMEMMIRLYPLEGLNIGVASGYTNATFRDYYTVNSQKQIIDCRNNHVPFIPDFTLNTDASYTFNISHSVVKSLVVAADCSTAQGVYWDEENLHKSSSSFFFGARFGVTFNNIDLQFWGKNLTNTKSQTFWFESMGRTFEQVCKPLQIGADIRFHL